MRMTDDYDPVVDAWRSIWEAMAIVNGHDPDVAVAGHKRLCEMMEASGDPTRPD